MHTPPNMTEAEVLAIIEEIVTVLGPRFVFAGREVDDIRQEGRLMALLALPNYRPEVGPLQNFLMTHVKRRLINLKRDQTRRIDAPCKRCCDGRPCGPDGRPCERYLRWEARQQARAARNKPASLDALPPGMEPRTSGASPVEETVETQELLTLIDQHLDVELRATYLQMRAGQSVPANRRRAVEQAVRDILGETVA